MGSLSVDLPFDKERDYEPAVKFFGVVASMIAQAVKINRLIDAERRRLLEENVHLREELRERYDFSNLIGNSGPMRRVYEQVTQVAPTNTTVMLRGESGTGKELIAHAIHYNSPRKNSPFIKVNCAALPETLIESELFGYEKGAFTGAHSQKKGRFELAEGGTLFLDEIGDLNASTAVKLLRVLQEREFDRLGGTKTVKADVRLIVATNKDLEKAIAAGTFREDLYYRLNVFAIFVPPLRERKSDVLLLADHFLEKYANQHGKNIKRISTPAIDMLMSYHWPGNVRELENTIERAVLVCDGNVIHGHHLPPTLQTAEASGTVTNVSFKEAVEAYEKDLIQDTLKTTRGNRAKAASLLKTTDRVINYKIKKAEYRLQSLPKLIAARRCPARLCRARSGRAQTLGALAQFLHPRIGQPRHIGQLKRERQIRPAVVQDFIGAGDRPCRIGALDQHRPASAPRSSLPPEREDTSRCARCGQPSRSTRACASAWRASSKAAAAGSPRRSLSQRGRCRRCRPTLRSSRRW